MANTIRFLLMTVMAATSAQRDEMEEAWKSVHDQRPNHVKMTSNSAYPLLDISSRDEFEFKRRGPRMYFCEKLVETRQGETKEFISCWVVNPRYAFVVEQVSPDAGWMLLSLALQGTKEYDWFVERLHLHDAVTTDRGIMVADTYLWDVVDKTDCQWVAMPDDPDRWQLAFKQQAEEPFTNDIGIPFRPTEGVIVLNQRQGWVVESVQLKKPDGKRETSTYRYEGSGDRVPVELVAQHDHGTVVRRIVQTEYSQSFSDDDFRLTAFGLPEPAELQDHSTRHLWYVGIGAVGLMFGGIWLLRRRQA